MTLPPIVAEFAATYEQEHGKQLSKQFLQIITYFERLGKALRDLGRDDAKKGRKPLAFSVFYDLTRYVIDDDAKEDNCTQIYAELMQEYYHDGYRL